MKKILLSILLLYTSVALFSQGNSSFLLADKNGNSFLVQNLIFQQDASGINYMCNSINSDNSNQTSFFISNLKFIARVKNDMTSANLEELKQMLEGFSGSDKADAEIVASVLSINENVDESFSADGKHVVIREKDSDFYTAYPLYDLQPAFFSEQLSEEISEMLVTPKHSSPKKTHLYDKITFGKVAIFNFFS